MINYTAKKVCIALCLLLSGNFIAQSSKYHSTFHIVKLYVDSAQINFTTTEEAGSIPFQIEQYLFGRWTNVGELPGKGTPDTNIYAMSVNFRNGENLFRVRQQGSESGPRLSLSTKYFAKLPEVNYTVEDGKIKFSRITHYQIAKDETLITAGCGLLIDILAFKKDEYTFRYDTKVEKINIR
jgi:hypothetical protein